MKNMIKIEHKLDGNEKLMVKAKEISVIQKSK